MEHLFEKYIRKTSLVDTSFVRGMIDKLKTNARMIGIKGSRGVGKTTLLLQYIKLLLQNDINSSLYVSLDDLWFSENRLTGLVDAFAKRGGKFLFLDEVHKYPNWSLELKNIYDDFPGLKIFFTGSSLLEMHNSRADLSRRAIVYNMQGMSFREYLALETGYHFDTFSLEDILSNHETLSREIVSKIKPLQYFPLYLQKGFYPFYLEGQDFYYHRLEEIINMILETELPQLRNLNTAYIIKIKQLLLVISESSPFVPNISKLSNRIGINRETLNSYLHYLGESNLIFSAYKNARGISALQKPDKIYLENSNLMYALNYKNVNIGNVRETFFVNQLKNKYLIEISKKTDFIVEGHFSFEIGGKNKPLSQTTDIPNAYIASDNIEYGYGNKIPLWLFGFLY